MKLSDRSVFFDAGIADTHFWEILFCYFHSFDLREIREYTGRHIAHRLRTRHRNRTVKTALWQVSAVPRSPSALAVPGGQQRILSFALIDLQDNRTFLHSFRVTGGEIRSSRPQAADGGGDALGITDLDDFAGNGTASGDRPLGRFAMGHRAMAGLGGCGVRFRGGDAAVAEAGRKLRPRTEEVGVDHSRWRLIGRTYRSVMEFPSW